MKNILVTCMNNNCENTFRIPEYKFNSTIKNNPNKQQCLICKNKKLLEQSTFNVTGKTSKFGTSKYTTKSKSSKKRTKTPRERFYSSTAWKWFSRYVLLYYSIDGKVVKCCTCGTLKAVNNKEMHTGHWIKVFNSNNSCYSTAFQFTNLGPQCSKCNVYMGGQERLMAEWLKEQHGSQELERLQQLSKQIFNLDEGTLKQIAEEYRIKFNKLLKERGWNNPWNHNRSTDEVVWTWQI